MPAGHLFPKVFEHGQQHRISASAALSGNAGIVVLFVCGVGEGTVFHQHQFVRVLEECAAAFRDGNEAVVLDVFIQEMQDEPLVDDRRPETGVVVFSGPEQFQCVVFVGFDHGIGLSRQDIGQVFQFETLRKGFDELDHQAHVFFPVEPHLGVEAVVAGPAVVREIIFAEVIQQQFPAALAGFGVGDGFVQELLADLLLRHRLPLHEFLQLLDVFITVVCEADAFLAIPPGPAGFLVISLYAFGNVVVDDKTDIRLVDAHAEGDGGHDDVHLFREELVLVLRPGLGIQAGVIGKGADAVDAQQLCHFLHLFPAEAIDDARLAGVLADKADDVFLRLHFVPDFIIQVGTVEGRAEHLGILDAQVLEDVALDLRGGRGGEGDHRRRLDLIDDGADLAVFRPEIMSPLGDAVGFVHGIERDPDLFQEVDVVFLG